MLPPLGTSLDGVVFNADQDGSSGPTYLDDDTVEADRQLVINNASPNTASYGGNNDAFFAFAPGGAGITGKVSASVKHGTVGTDGAWGTGDRCVFVGEVSLP